MTSHQAIAFAIVGAAVVAFASGRFRYDVVALGALVIGVLSGIGAARAAFSGFAGDVVVIVASALVVIAAIALQVARKTRTSPRSC